MRSISKVRTSEPGYLAAALMATLSSLLLPGCGDGGLDPAQGPGGGRSGAARNTQPPVITSVEVIPNPARLSDRIATRVRASDPEGEHLTYRWQWYVNGQPVPGETGPILTPQHANRGDSVSVEVTPEDTSGAGQSKMSDPVSIVNSTPKVTKLEVTPDALTVGESVTVKAEGTDADGDLVDFTFRWWRNHQKLQEGPSSTLELREFQRGDTLVVEVIPSDSTGDGVSAFSREYPLNNAPPRITSVQPGPAADGRLRYQVTAVDPDGDPLVYALVSGPNGMTVDPGTGRIEWSVPAQPGGRYPVTVSVEDGQGGRVTQQFDLIGPSGSG